MRKVLVPPHSVQVRLTTIFHTWLPAFQEWGVGNRESLWTAEEPKDTHLKNDDLQILETLPHGCNGAQPQARNSDRSDRGGREGLEGLSVGMSLGEARGLWALIMRTLGPEVSYRLCNLATPRAKLISTSGTCSAAALAQPALRQAAGVPSALSKAPQPDPSRLPEWRQFQPNLSAWLDFFSLPTVCQWLQNCIFC